MSSTIPGPSTIITPSSKAPPGIPRNPSSKIPQSGTRQLAMANQGTVFYSSSNITPSKSIYEKNLNRRPLDVSLSSFSFIFGETIQYLQKQSNGIQDLESK